MSGILVGAVGTFKAIPEPVGAVIPAGVVPKWTSSDVTIATVVDPNPDPTGLTAQVNGIAPGAITLTCSATLPDNTTATGALAVSVSAPPPPEVSSFLIEQVS